MRQKRGRRSSDITLSIERRPLSDKPLTVVAYAATGEFVAYIEPVGVGDPLPEMPIFLTGDRYVPCPLEDTYQTAWEQFPAPLKKPLLDEKTS